jgi:hypothetical protein
MGETLGPNLIQTRYIITQLLHKIHFVNLGVPLASEQKPDSEHIAASSTLISFDLIWCDLFLKQQVYIAFVSESVLSSPEFF